MKKRKIKKILCVTNDLLFVHQHLYYILSYLSKSKGLEVFLASSKKSLDNYKIPSKVKFVSIPITRKPHLIKDLNSIIKLTKIIRKEKPELIISFTPKAGFISLVVSKLFFSVINVHTFTGQVWANMKGIKAKFYRFIDSLIAVNSTLCLADSESQAIFLNKKLYFSKKIIGLKNGSLSGVDLERFKIEDINLKSSLKFSKGIKYLYLGRLNIDKGINDLIQIVPKHLKTFKKDQFTFVGPCEDINILKNLNNIKEKWPKNIIINGFTNNPESFLKNADILLLPSRREGFSNTIIEAASCKVPTIAYDIYGIKNSLKNNVTGLLAKPFSILDFSNLMKLCSNNTEIINKLSQKAYLYSRQFSHKKRTKVFINTILKNISSITF